MMDAVCGGSFPGPAFALHVCSRPLLQAVERRVMAFVHALESQVPCVDSKATLIQAWQRRTGCVAVVINRTRVPACVPAPAARPHTHTGSERLGSQPYNAGVPFIRAYIDALK